MHLLTKYLVGILLSIWPLFLINEFGVGMVAIIIINLWIGIAVGEHIAKHE